MNLYWTMSSIPELRELPPGQRRAVYYRCVPKLHRRWQSWVGNLSLIMTALVVSSLGDTLVRWAASAQVSVPIAALKIPVLMAVYLPLSRILDHHLIRPHLREELGTTHCPRCGYDVRAARDRCSECGEALPANRGRQTEKPVTGADTEVNPHDVIWDPVERGETEHVRRMMAERPELAGVAPSDDALLHVAWQVNRPLIGWLLENGVSADQRDSLGGTVLMYASAEDDERMVSLLLAHGAEVNARNEAGETAFSYACTNDSFRVATLLHNAGADVNTVDAGGGSPLDWAAGYASEAFYRWLLEIGCRQAAGTPTRAS